MMNIRQIADEILSATPEATLAEVTVYADGVRSTHTIDYMTGKLYKHRITFKQTTLKKNLDE